MSSTFPPPDHPILAQLADDPGGRKSGWRWLAIIATVVAIVSAFVLFAIWFVPTEAQKWRIAAAEEKWLNGDFDAALAQLDEDIARDPRNIELRRTKATWLLEKKDYRQALSEVNQIIAWRSTDVYAYQLRAQIFQSQGEFDKAVDDWKTIMDFDAVAAGAARAQCLNGLAYARALANVEIDEGLANVNEAIRITVENYAMLDTRGFLYYRKMDFDRALQDLNHSVEFVESEYQDSLSGGFASPDRREKERSDKLRAQTVAVIRYHRGLVHEALGDQEKAELDYARVRELGFEPNEQLF